MSHLAQSLAFAVCEAFRRRTARLGVGVAAQHPGRRALITAGLVAGALSMLLPATSAGAAVSTLYVNAASPCSDSGTGTAALPFCSIKKAASVATAGQTVVVASGVYAGDIAPKNSGTSSAPISYTIAPGASVTVQGG